MRIFSTVALIGVLMFGLTGIAVAQANAPQPQGPPAIHGPRLVDQELDHLTRDLALTPKQRKQVRSLLEEHHDRIQALFGKNPGVSRQDLAPQIHANSDETHKEIHVLLTEHHKQLEKAMLEHMHTGEESRRPDLTK